MDNIKSNLCRDCVHIREDFDGFLYCEFTKTMQEITECARFRAYDESEESQ